MKKTILFLVLITLGLFLQAQTILTYKSHGLIPDDKNPMRITKYQEPGMSGKNVVWNFSLLEITTDFVGTIQNTLVTKGCNRFSSCNSVLEEHGNFFYFKGNDNCLEQYGFVAGNSDFYITYSKPFVKMQYPFTYNSHFNGSFEGEYFSQDKKFADIAGSYNITGDGIGKLILPEGKSFENVLRVKEVKSYKQTSNGSSVGIEDITYRWYVNNHRFPILVFINSTYTYENGKTSSTTKAAYNSNVITLNTNNIVDNEGFKLNVFPNPYKENLNIVYTLETTSYVNVSIYDLSGKVVSVLVNQTESAGEKTVLFSARELGMTAGAYLVKVKINDKETTRKVMEL